jgi:hypothetical protein
MEVSMTKATKTAPNKRKTAVQASPAKQDVNAGADHVQRVRIGTNTARKNAGRTADQPRESSKAYEILNLLRRRSGASIAEMQKATGWQSHSVRGFLSGTVKKRMGLTLKSVQPEKGDRRYIVAGA